MCCMSPSRDDPSRFGPRSDDVLLSSPSCELRRSTVCGPYTLRRGRLSIYQIELFASLVTPLASSENSPSPGRESEHPNVREAKGRRRSSLSRGCIIRVHLSGLTFLVERLWWLDNVGTEAGIFPMCCSGNENESDPELVCNRRPSAWNIREWCETHSPSAPMG